MPNFRGFVLIIFLLHTVAFGQFSNVIPNSRRVDWSRVGVEGGIRRNVDLQIDFSALKNANPGMSDHQVFQMALQQANSFKNTNPGKWVSIYFPSGTYTFNGYVDVAFPDSNLIIRGNGSNSTVFNFTVADAPLFSVASGSGGQTFTSIDAGYGFAKGSKTVKAVTPMTNLMNGDWIELVESNGSWHGNYDREWPCNTGNYGSNPQNYVGQIVRVKTISADKTVLELHDELRINYEANLDPRIRRITPIRNIGFENFRINSQSSTNTGSANFSFGYAVNCWIWGVESYNASSAHVTIGASSHIEVRGSYFHHAKSYGGGGRGYGVSIGDHSTNCLVEDNIFSHLRHAMILSTGANGNVFGYNHSRDQIDDNFVYNEADMSVHGHYPFANLFEGNDVFYGVADDYWGANGPYNTFFRNWIATSVWLEKADYTNALGNEFSTTYGGFYKNGGGNFGDCNQNHPSSNVFDVYGIFIGGGGQYGQPTHNQAMFSYLIWYNSVLNDVSYYRSERPSFLSSSYTWPPMGPPYGYSPSTNTAYETSQWIPALDRWNSNPKTVAASPLILPLSVSISGPSVVSHPPKRQVNRYTWTANPVGGLPPYSFTWFKEGYPLGVTTQSYAEEYQYNGYGDGSYQFTLRVDVRDAQNTLASATMVVTAYNSGGGGGGELPSIEERILDATPLPSDFSLAQNYPNPFNPETEIAFGLPEPATVRIVVSDLLGREIVVLSDGNLTPGYHYIRWSGVDAAGEKVGSGIYFYRITATGASGKQFSKVMKMLLTK